MPEDKALYHLKLLFENDVENVFERKITDLFPAIIYVYDSDKKQLQYVNNRITDVLGYSLEDVKGWNDDFMQLVFKDDVERVKEELEKYLSLNDDESHSYQSRLNHKEGKWRYFKTLGTVLRRNPEGKPGSLLFIAQDITDQIKSAEEASAISKLFSETEHLLNFGAWSWNMNTKEVYWSEGLYILLGYEKDKVLEKGSLELALKHISGQDLEMLKQKVKRSIEEKTGFEHTCKLVNNFNRELTISSRGKYIEENGTAKIAGITRDVTEQVDFNQALVDFRLASDEREKFLQFGSWESEHKTGRIKWSDGMYRLFGYDPNQIPKPVISEEFYAKHISPKDMERGRRIRESITRDQQNEYSWQFEITGGDGSKKLLETFGKIIRNGEDQQTERVIGTTRDITVEASSREKIRWYRDLMAEKEEHLNYGTWQYDYGINRTYFSAGIYRLFDQPLKNEEEISRDEGEFFIDYIAEEDRERVCEIWTQLRENGGSEIFDYKIVLKNGDEKTLQSIAKVIKDEEGNKIRLIGTTYDITKLKQYEQELKFKIRDLDRSNKELEEFAYVASHDMQEPLRKVSTFSEILQDRFSEELGSEGLSYLNRMSTASNNMRMLIENLLSFSRLTRVNQPFEKADLNILIGEVISELELKIAETKTTITYDQFPILEVIPIQIKQLFNNLLSNAIKFCHPERDCEIIIKSEKLTRQQKQAQGLIANKNYFKISIKDNGIGFEPEYSNQIFQIFQRLHGKSEYPGSGIGLAICKKIIENHFGIIEGEGRPTEGSTFTIILPEFQ